MTGEADLHERQHAERVLACVHERIAEAGGWLPFDQYMQIALYEPGLGYYSAGAHKLGAAGDFVTAPEISPLFARCLATQCAAVLEALPGGDIVELGAGSGRLAVDVLAALAARDALPGRYRILEVSADLRERQQQRVGELPAQLAARVEWLDAPPQQGWSGVLLANEVLDALPCECFAVRNGVVFERGVAARPRGRARLAAAAGAPGAARGDRTARASTRAGNGHRRTDRRCVPGSARGSRRSRRRCRRAWRCSSTMACRAAITTIRSAIRARCAATTGSCAHADPFAHPGLEDLTAWVDFTRVAEAADAAGLEVLGFTTQAALLLALGIEAEVAAAPDEATRIRRASEARQLLMPDEMGETFKAIALGRRCDLPLAGFGLRDLRGRL